MAETVQPVLHSLLGKKAVIVGAPQLMGRRLPSLVIENEKHRYLYMYVGSAKPAHFKKAQAQGNRCRTRTTTPTTRWTSTRSACAKVGTVTLLEFLTQGAGNSNEASSKKTE